VAAARGQAKGKVSSATAGRPVSVTGKAGAVGGLVAGFGPSAGAGLTRVGMGISANFIAGASAPPMQPVDAKARSMLNRRSNRAGTVQATSASAAGLPGIGNATGAGMSFQPQQVLQTSSPSAGVFARAAATHQAVLVFSHLLDRLSEVERLPNADEACQRIIQCLFNAIKLASTSPERFPLTASEDLWSAVTDVQSTDMGSKAWALGGTELVLLFDRATRAVAKGVAVAASLRPEPPPPGVLPMSSHMLTRLYIEGQKVEREFFDDEVVYTPDNLPKPGIGYQHLDSDDDDGGDEDGADTSGDGAPGGLDFQRRQQQSTHNDALGAALQRRSVGGSRMSQSQAQPPRGSIGAGYPGRLSMTRSTAR
jgi:hypothetical protein